MKGLYSEYSGASRVWGVLLIISVVLSLISLAGVIVAHIAVPAEVEQDTALVNYEHMGRFDFLVYQKPSYLFGPEPDESQPLIENPRYPTEIIDTIDISFSYETADTKQQPVEIYAVLENPGIWTKEITLVPEVNMSRDFIIIFPLSISELNQVFDTIDKEIGITSSRRIVTVIAHVGEGSEEFSLPIDMGKNLIEVDNNLTQAQTHSSAKFDYIIHLKENSLFDTDTLKPPPVETPAQTTSPSPKAIEQGEVIFSRLVDNIEANFSYDFKSDQPVEGLREEVTITATIENPDVWSKSIVMVPPTSSDGSVSIGFPLDVAYFTEILEAIRTETGVYSDTHNLTIKADVHVTAQTEFGEVDEVFSQTLSSTLGRGIIQWKEQLEKTQPGSISVTKMISNPNHYLGLSAGGVRTLSVALAGSLSALCLVSLGLYFRSRSPELSPIDQKAWKIGLKYAKWVAEINSQVPTEAEKIVSVASIEDLVKVSDELLKPILHQGPTSSHSSHRYFVFDDAIRYEYLLTEKSA